MKKIFLSLIFAFFSISAFALSQKDFSLSVEPLFGFKYGQIDEYVFTKLSKFSEDKLSELNWEIKPELYYGLKIRGGWKGFFEETHFSAGIPLKSGMMMDSDWQNIEISAANGGNTAQTNYSESDNYLDYDFSFGFKGGYEFQIRKIFKLKPTIAFEYDNIKFTGKNGTFWYGSTSDTFENDIKKRFAKNDIEWNYDGRDIGYNRISYYFWLGSDFSIDLPQKFTITTGFFLAPYVYAVSYDAHYLKYSKAADYSYSVADFTYIDYADLTTGFFAAFKWKFGVEYKFNERHSINLNANYFYMRVLRGKDYQKYSTASSYSKPEENYEGGAGAKWFDLALSYRFKIF